MFNTFNKKRTAALIISALTISTAFSSFNVSAHNSCDVDLKAGFSINEAEIKFFNPDNENKTLYIINKTNGLIVKGQKVTLDSKQQSLINHYSTSIRVLVPEVRTIAIEGVDLALEGVNLAFNELLGEGNSVGAELTQELTSLRDKVANHYTIEHGFSIGNNGLADDELLTGEFEQSIESAVEKTVMNSMGSIMMAVGKDMMTSGGDGNTFETRMEKFGENIEHEMEVRAEQIEVKAEKLCVKVAKIDSIEEQLKVNIPALANINVLSVRQTTKRDDQHSM